MSSFFLHSITTSLILSESAGSLAVCFAGGAGGYDCFAVMFAGMTFGIWPALMIFSSGSV